MLRPARQLWQVSANLRLERLRVLDFCPQCRCLWRELCTCMSVAQSCACNYSALHEVGEQSGLATAVAMASYAGLPPERPACIHAHAPLFTADMSTPLQPC